MQKNITNYISDSFKILFSNKILFLIGAINTVFVCVCALISYSLTSGFFDSNMFINISSKTWQGYSHFYKWGRNCHLALANVTLIPYTHHFLVANPSLMRYD